MHMHVGRNKVREGGQMGSEQRPSRGNTQDAGGAAARHFQVQSLRRPVVEVEFGKEILEVLS